MYPSISLVLSSFILVCHSQPLQWRIWGAWGPTTRSTTDSTDMLWVIEDCWNFRLQNYYLCEQFGFCLWIRLHTLIRACINNLHCKLEFHLLYWGFTFVVRKDFKLPDVCAQIHVPLFFVHCGYKSTIQTWEQFELLDDSLTDAILCGNMNRRVHNTHRSIQVFVNDLPENLRRWDSKMGIGL